jgi:hypothetical protein
MYLSRQSTAQPVGVLHIGEEMKKQFGKQGSRKTKLCSLVLTQALNPDLSPINPPTFWFFETSPKQFKDLKAGDVCTLKPSASRLYESFDTSACSILAKKTQLPALRMPLQDQEAKFCIATATQSFPDVTDDMELWTM